MAKEIVLVCPKCNHEFQMEFTTMLVRKIIKCENKNCKYSAEHLNWTKKDPVTGKIWSDKNN